MADSAPKPVHCCEAGHIIIAGFGIVGRAVAESLDRLNRSYCVIELNAQTVTRCTRIGVSIIEGDVREEATLQRAGVATASVLALAMPDEQQTLAALRVARRLNPAIKILVRCTFTSAGLQAHRLGANAVVVAEQVVALEFAKVLEESMLK